MNAPYSLEVAEGSVCCLTHTHTLWYNSDQNKVAFVWLTNVISWVLFYSFCMKYIKFTQMTHMQWKKEEEEKC